MVASVTMAELTAEPPAPSGPPATEAGDRVVDLATVARGGALNLVGAAGSGVFTFLFYVVVARALHPAQVGAFFVGTAVFTIVSTSAVLGADIGYIRLVPRARVLRRPREVRRMLLVGLLPVAVFSLACTAVTWVLAPQLASLIGGADGGAQAADFVRLFSLFLTPAALFLTLVAATQGFGTMVPSVLVDKLGRTGLQLAAGIAVMGIGAAAMVWAFAAPYLAGLLAIGLWSARLVRRIERNLGQPGEVVEPGVVRRFWGFCAPRGVANCCQVVVLWFDTILLGVMTTSDQAGTYAVATRYLVVGHLAIGAMIQVVGPLLSELLARETRDRTTAVYQTATAWLMCLVWPAYITLAVFAPFLLRVFGHHYVAGQTTLLILSIAMLVAVASGPVDVVLLMGGHSWWSLANWILAVVIDVGLDLVLIPRMGMKGAAIGWAASILARNLIPLLEVYLLLGLHPFGAAYARVVVAAGVCYGAVGVAIRVFVGVSAPAVLLYLIVATAAYVAVLHRMRHRLDLDALRAAVVRRRRRSVVGAVA